MIIIAILATLGAIVWTFLVFFANGMSSRPTEGLEGGSTVILAWIICGTLWFAWWWG